MKIDYGLILDMALYIYALIFLFKKLRSRKNKTITKKQKQQMNKILKSCEEANLNPIDKETLQLVFKIKEQKQILRNKINDVRSETKKRNEAEIIVKELLNKYHLTEEMLKDDDEDLQIKEIMDRYNI